MKLGDLIRARQTLSPFLQQKLNVNLAYKLMKFMKATEEDQEFWQKNINDLFQEFGTTDKNGNINVPKEKTEEFNVKYTELVEQEAKDPGIKFTLSELGEFTFSPVDMIALEVIIQEAN